MEYANLIFRQTLNPNLLLFNSMIKAYSLSGPFKESFHLFSSMKNRGIWPDQFTLAPLLKSCSNLADLKLGQVVHRETLVLGFGFHSSLRIGIVELYVSCERIEDAKKMFDEMPYRDVIVWNLMIRGYCKLGHLEMGLCLFRQMRERSTVTWNTMISCLASGGRDSDALELFHEMWDSGIEPDDATVVTLLPLCARLGALDVGKWIHSYAQSNGLSQDFISAGNSIVDFYCKCGIPETALGVFNEMHRKNVISWNCMILGMAFNGMGELGVELFERMINNGVNPNDSTFLGVLTCCAHAGLVEKGKELYASMNSKHNMEPKPEHHGCMVDLYGRSGLLKEAYDLIVSLPVRPNSALWGALLGACRSYGDVELAECALKELIKIEPSNSGNYVLLSNIYAQGERWNEVEKVRELMIAKNVKKVPGQSFIG